ncbi:MAG: T9SS type A sorting domain-containing protein [Bacteroidia bacterium]
MNLVLTCKCLAQCTISSSCGYNVQISISPVSIVPSTTICPYGYNYNVTFNYTITVTGINTCYNGNIGIQPQIFCNGGQNNGYYTINIAAPTVGNPSSTNTYSGSLTTTTNQYRGLSDCNIATPTLLGCNSIDIGIFGPGIPSQTKDCDQSPLPIKLLNFSAININNQYVKLYWQTALEINNDFFTIERSINGLEWEEVSKIKGAGNSNTLLNYSTFDNNPYSGVSYYRLKQTDFDGQFEYFDIRSVKIDNLINSQVFVYPNPTENIITIIGDETDLENLKIYNMLGQDITALCLIINKNDGRFIIDLTRLSKGMYLIKTKTKVNTLYKK